MSEADRQLRRVASHKRTICEVLRELWDISLELDETLSGEVQARLEAAYEMAKNMDRRLREHKYDWDEGFWEANANYAADLRRRTQRKEEG